MNIAVINAKAVIFLLQTVPEPLGDEDGSVPSSRTPDGNSQVAFTLLDELGHQEIDETEQLRQELFALWRLEDIVFNLLASTRFIPHLSHVEGVGQKSRVKNQVRINRKPVFVSKTHHQDLHLPSFFAEEFGC